MQLAGAPSPSAVGVLGFRAREKTWKGGSFKQVREIRFWFKTAKMGTLTIRIESRVKYGSCTHN